MIIINDLPKKIKHAGFKARQDILIILAKYYPSSKQINVDSGLSITSRFLSSLKLLFSGMFICANTHLVVNYPLGKPRWFFLGLLKYVKKIKIIAIIHDLESLRGKNNDDANNLNMCDFIISHNRHMSKFIRSLNVTKPKIINLGIFDYLLDGDINFNISRMRDFNPAVLFAGNLNKEKSGFLYKWSPEYNVDLYGINLSEMKSDKIKWQGAFDPNDPDINSDKDYLGLVWDGDSCSSCSGVCGEYLKINNPHKISFYLSQGIPIIVWSKSAMADFVISNNIGYAIDDLGELRNILNSINEKQYYKIKNNAINIGNNLRKGKYLLSAMSEILKQERL
ncbi:TPA: hypothetical protein ACG0Q0_002607 [Escherichia coli]|uniref:hypothetical protein n=1 Tax=Escherichia coli TaxID=562 RepID=UPI000F530330|nr:hypothetical protein [Escherichia coli]EFE7735475.1 hypothetical protein [Escherichia coli]EKJ3243716.1 hypothetical protein [Escherichia coli]ELK0551806.1 hypothetical protein [Escherichia coli]MHP10785.1 hypothetical protein [Escherichia coli]RRC19001.1 hypothetical protein EIA17_11380 [Escherichia coli]